MKILLLGAFAKGALELYYLNGLKRSTSDVDTFDIATNYYQRISKNFGTRVLNKLRPQIFFKPLNDSLLKYIAGKKYDVIVVFKGLTLFPETVATLKDHATLLCCYNPDHPYKFFSEGSGNSNILNSISLYDIYITYSRSIAADLASKFKVTSYTIPFGYDDYGAFIPPPSSISDNQEILFAGAYDDDRAAILSQISDNNLAIYGDAKWHTRTRGNLRLRRCFKGRGLFEEEYKTAICSAAGVLNLLRKQNIEENSHNMRTFEVPGYGGVLLANRTGEQLEFFEEDKEAIYFGSTEELGSKIQFLLSNPSKVLSIKKFGHDRAVRSGYGYSCRSRQLFNLLRERLH